MLHDNGKTCCEQSYKKLFSMIALMLCIASLVACGINEAPDFGEGIGEAVALCEEECRYIL